MSDGTQVSLGAELRSVARTRIVRAARAVLVRQGFHTTVDDVASAAGVSRRTVFRHFPSHSELIAAALTEILDTFAAQLPSAAPPDADVDDWLVETAIWIHGLHADCVGQTFWDLYADRPDVAPEVVEVIATIRALRRTWGEDLAAKAWRASGGLGAPPRWVTDAFLLQLSGFAYNALAIGGASREETGRVCGRILAAVLTAALADQGDA